MIRKAPIIGILLFAWQSSLIICAIWEPSNVTNEIICKSPACLERGKLYFANLNPAVNPCDDFYSFACGAWYVENKPAELAVQWTVEHVLNRQIIQDLRDILEKPTRRPDPDLMQVKYFYDLCMRQPFYGKKSPNKIASRIRSAGRFGKKPVWDIHDAYLKLTGESAFFYYVTYALRPKELVPVLIVGEKNTPYGSIIHGVWKPTEEKNYEQFLFELMKSLKLPGADSTLRARIKLVVKFRHQLNEIISKSRQGSEMQTALMSAKEFEKWFKRFTPGKSKQSGMPWEKILQTILSVIPKGPKAKHDMRIITAREESYFKGLAKLLTSTSEDVLVGHMEMYFAERHTVFTSKMEDLLEKTTIEPSDLEEFILGDTPKWEICIRHHSMWPQIGKILQEKWFKNSITHPMLELINGVKGAIESQIKESNWLDHKTKEETIGRVRKVEPWIGYPPWYRDPSTDINSESATTDPLVAQAFLNIRRNVMFIKSPLLRSPFFDPNLPKVYNVGAMGYVLGHEMYHVIHECGMHVGVDFRNRWWPNEMRDRCYERMKCFTSKFQRETEREFLLTYHDTIKMTNTKTYIEDYPDVMGLDAAFRLYEGMQKIDGSVCRTLPRFERYSCEQMFFISFANTKCGRMTAKAARQHVESGTTRHSLDSVRINGAVQNSQSFQKAFQCPQGAPMNPSHKCNLWK